LRVRICAIFVVVCLLAGSTASSSELSKTFPSMAGQQADFIHSFTPKGFTKAQIEKGSVVFGTPPMMRWSYMAPEEKLFVFDGTTSWLYSKGDQQVTVNQLTDEQRRNLPFLFLPDSEKVGNHYRIRERASGIFVITTLKALDKEAAVQEIKATFSSSDYLIRKLEYLDRQGNRTVFEFNAFRPAKTTADTFRFKPPAGVDVVRN